MLFQSVYPFHYLHIRMLILNGEMSSISITNERRYFCFLCIPYFVVVSHCITCILTTVFHEAKNRRFSGQRFSSVIYVDDNRSLAFGKYWVQISNFICFWATCADQHFLYALHSYVLWFRCRFKNPNGNKKLHAAAFDVRFSNVKRGTIMLGSVNNEICSNLQMPAFLILAKSQIWRFLECSSCYKLF